MTEVMAQTKTVRQTEQFELEESVTKTQEGTALRSPAIQIFKSAGCAVGGNSGQRTRVPRGSVETARLISAHSSPAHHQLA